MRCSCAQPVGHADDPRRRRRGGARDARRAGRLCGRRSRRRRARRDSAGCRCGRPRRQADVCRGHAGARRRPHPLHRRAGGDRGGADARAGAGRRRAGRASIMPSCRAPPMSSARPPQGAAAIHAQAPGNIALDWTDGDAAAVEAAFAHAAHVERVRLLDTRLAPVSMEPRSGIGMWDAATAALHADREHAGRRGGAQAAGRGRIQGAALDHPRAHA